jgi:hypothetical protein
MLSTVPKGGKRHTALSESLPQIKNAFLKEGHQLAVDKLNERSRTVLDKGLQRIAKGALGAKDEKGVQAHDDAAFDLINKYVLSEAKFDEKDADAMYDKYLGYAGAKQAGPAEVPAKGDVSGRQTMEYNYARDGGNSLSVQIRKRTRRTCASGFGWEREPCITSRMMVRISRQYINRCRVHFRAAKIMGAPH